MEVVKGYAAVYWDEAQRMNRLGRVMHRRGDCANLTSRTMPLRGYDDGEHYHATSPETGENRILGKCKECERRIKIVVPDWSKAACAGSDSDMFMADQKNKKNVERLQQAVKDYCDNCEIREECGTYAVEEKLDFGVWGGTIRFKRSVI